MIKKKKEITLDGLSQQIANLAKHTDHQIDDLAAMTMRGFNDMQEQIDKRFDAVERRLDGHDKKFISIDERFDRIDQRFNKVDAEISSLRAELRTAIKDINSRLDSIEKMTKEDISCMGDEIFEVKKRIEKLEKNYLELKSAH